MIYTTGNPNVDNLMELGLYEMEANTLIRLINKLKVKNSNETYSEIENDAFWYEGGVEIESLFSLLKDQLPIVKSEKHLKLEKGLEDVDDDEILELIKFELNPFEGRDILLDLCDERKETILINI